MTANFTDPHSIEKTIAKIFEQGAVDIALIAHGFLPMQEHCQQDLQVCHDALEVNAISPIMFAEALIGQMTMLDHGTLVVISSVAGDRGRKSNYVYGAAKAMIDCYVQGLQHRSAGTQVAVVLVKPGPTKTPMTAHLVATGLPLARVEQVAASIIKAISRKQPVVYVPGKWRWIMLILRHLPNLIFNKLNI